MYRLGDTVKKQLPSVFHALNEEQMNERLAYALIGQMHPDDEPKYELVNLTTQEMVDEANASGFWKNEG